MGAVVRLIIRRTLFAENDSLCTICNSFTKRAFNKPLRLHRNSLVGGSEQLALVLVNKTNSKNRAKQIVVVMFARN